jgi:hypothetical protein
VIVTLLGIAAAQETSVHGTEDLRIRYTHVPEELENFEDRDILDYVETVERLDLTGGGSRFGVGARVDGVALFANRYILDGTLYHEHDLLGDGLSSPFPDAYLDIEKIWFEARSPTLTVTGGDSYLSFGRGITLNLVKNTDIDVDTSLRGLKGAAHVGPWDVTIASGLTNPQQVALENPNIAIQPDVAHAVTGLRVDRYGIGPVNLGVQGVLYQFSRGYEAAQDGWRAYGQDLDAFATGGSVEALGVGGVDLYAEGDFFGYSAAEIPVDSGWAAYGSAGFYPGRATVLLEVRANRDTEWVNTFSSGYEIASGPTLEYERVITEDSSAAVNSNDIVGGRARVDLSLGDGIHSSLLPYASVAVFRDSDLGSLHFNTTPETILHPIVGAQYLHGEMHVMANVGQRVDVRDPAANGDSLGADTQLHGDFDVAVPLGGKLAIELAPSFMRYHWGVNPQQQSDYTDFSNTLAVKIGSPWAVLLYTDFSNNPLINSSGNLEPLLGPSGENLYGAVELQWLPNSSTTVKAFYGAYRAGIRCAGGQCRSLPGFNGAKLSLTTAF